MMESTGSQVLSVQTIEHLLCVRHGIRLWGQAVEKKRYDSCPHGDYDAKGTSLSQRTVKAVDSGQSWVAMQ